MTLLAPLLRLYLADVEVLLQTDPMAKLKYEVNAVRLFVVAVVGLQVQMGYFGQFAVALDGFI